MGACDSSSKAKRREVKAKVSKTDIAKNNDQSKKDTRRTVSDFNMSKEIEKDKDRDNIDEKSLSKIQEKATILPDQKSERNYNQPKANLSCFNKNIIPIVKENDQQILSTSLDKLINQTKEPTEEEMLFQFNSKDIDPLYFINEIAISPTANYSSDSEFDNIIHNRNIQSKILQASMLLSLKERQWNKENIILSDMIKENRCNLDSNIFNKYLRLMIQLQEHFNWLTWALSYYYYSALYSQNAKPFSIRDTTLPFVDSVEWLDGFEWKGLFVRVQGKDKSSNLFKEMKGLKYAFFDYIQLLENSHGQDTKSTNPLLSNELIFPLMAYGEFCGLILYATPCIKKYNYEYDFEQKQVFDLSNGKGRLSVLTNNAAFLSMKTYNKTPFKAQRKNTYNRSITKPTENHNNKISSNNLNNNDISNIEKNSIYSLNISNNINNDICLKNYSSIDLNDSKILSKIKSRHLIKVIDDLMDNTGNKEKFKYMLINVYDLIPNLFDIDTKEYNFLSFDNATKKKHFYDMSPLHSSKNPIETLENEFKMKININSVKNLETKFKGIQIKIIYNDPINTSNNNISIKKDNTSCVADSLIKVTFEQNESLTKQIQASPDLYASVPKIQPLQLKISNENIIQYQLLNPLKQCYSLIKSIKSSTTQNESIEENFMNKSCYLDYFNTFWKRIDQNISSIQTIHHLKKEMKKYGINSSLMIFALPIIQSKYLSDLIKVSLLSKMIGNFIDFHEDANLMLKFILYENNHDLSILRNTGFDFLSKDNCLKEIRKEKIYYLIKSLLFPNEVRNNAYVAFNIEQLSLYVFIERIKWKKIDDIMEFGLLKSFPLIYETKSLLKEFIRSAREHPFIFLSGIEEKLQFVINPFIKFKASLSLESFQNELRVKDLQINEPSINTFINSKEISSYILAKSINLCKNPSRVPTLSNLVGGVVNTPQFLHTKVNLDDYLKSNQPNNCDLSEDYRGESRSNMNNQTQIGSYHESSNSTISKTNKMLQQKTNNNAKTERNVDWKDIESEVVFCLEPIVYKMKYECEPKSSSKTLKYFNCFMNSYTTKTVEAIKEWKNSIEMILIGITTCNAQIEESLLICYKILFIYYFYIEKDVSEARSLLVKMKEIIRNPKIYTYNQCATINLFEGIVSDDYIKSEEYFSKALIFSLFQYGDPRGRRNKGHNINMFPLWKLARQTCVLENQLTNEHFKEMFHSQEYNSRNDFKEDEDVSNYYNRKIQYKTPKHLNDNNNKRVLNYNQSTDSFCCLNEDINEIPTRNPFSKDNNPQKAFALCESNINEISSLGIKPFKFPSTSDVKTSFTNYFFCQEFCLFLMKTMISLDNDGGSHISEDFLNCIGMKMICDMDDESDARHETSSKTVTSHKDRKKGSNKVLSHYLFDELMKKLSYKSNSPDGVLISFGKNNHYEISHDNYDMLSLPRVVFKLKDRSVNRIFSGWEHSIAIDNKGNCLSWGRNHNGQCGINKLDPVRKPTQISFESPMIIKEVSCGNDHSLALNDQGIMYSFGNPEDGVLGIEGLSNKIQYTPIKIPFKETVVKIASGTLHNIALTKEGKVYTWGSSKGGQLGLSEAFFIAHPQYLEYVPKPTLVTEFHSKITKIACGEAHSLALTESGLTYSWGFGSNGQLGLGFCEDSFEPGTGMTKSRIIIPRLISKLPDVIDIQSGKTFSMFILKHRELYACGVNDLKQLGIEDEAMKSHLFHKDIKCYDIVNPTPVEYFLNMKVRRISCGEGHCLAIIQDLSTKIENVWTWGNNHFGQLGLGNQLKASLPKPLIYMNDFKRNQVVDISCGGFHSLILIKRQKKYDEQGDLEEIEKIINKSVIF